MGDAVKTADDYPAKGWDWDRTKAWAVARNIEVMWVEAEGGKFLCRAVRGKIVSDWVGSSIAVGILIAIDLLYERERTV